MKKTLIPPMLICATVICAFVVLSNEKKNIHPSEQTASIFPTQVPTFTADNTPAQTQYIEFSSGEVKVYDGGALVAKRNKKGVWSVYNSRKALEAMYKSITAIDSVCKSKEYVIPKPESEVESILLHNN